jgi:hypothetical protein
MPGWPKLTLASMSSMCGTWVIRFVLTTVCTSIRGALNGPLPGCYQVTNYPSLLRELHRVLRPGGILLSGEFENETYGAAEPEVPLGDAVPRLSRALALIRDTLAAQGVFVDAGRKLPSMLADPELFAPRPLELGSKAVGAESKSDSGSGGSFSSIASSSYAASARTPSTSRQLDAHSQPLIPFIHITPQTFHIPATDWPDFLVSPARHEAGRRLVFALRRGWPSLVPLLTTRAGLSPEDAHEVVNGALEDHFVDPELRLILCYHTVWAVKA